jgi:hypothetical protein
MNLDHLYEIVSFIDENHPAGCRWGYLVSRDQDDYSRGVVFVDGEYVQASQLLMPYPAPSANLIVPYQLDPWEAFIDLILNTREYREAHFKDGPLNFYPDNRK